MARSTADPSSGEPVSSRRLRMVARMWNPLSSLCRIFSALLIVVEFSPMMPTPVLGDNRFRGSFCPVRYWNFGVAVNPDPGFPSLVVRRVTRCDSPDFC